jgi:hypothetical protein
MIAMNPYPLAKHKRTIPADHFMGTIAANVDNDKLSDAEFRQFIRNTLTIVEYPRPEKPA